MPCPKCGNTRLFTYERIACPNCDNIKTSDAASQIGERKTALQKAEKDLEKRMLGADLNEVFKAALEKRELVAEKIIKDPWTHGKEIIFDSS